VSDAHFESEWDRIFGKKEEEKDKPKKD